MSLDYVRKIVSGNKARYVNDEVNLDLVYVTDRIIIMGYPAVGISALYRNRRRDVLKFINSRHGEKWWIWNLCPLYENAYTPETMHNRVSRYPFPDHHPPPLPLLPLAVKEMTAWLEGDDERVAIIHCKAGKGRSGTLLCSYMLSLSQLPPSPQLDRSYTKKELLDRQKDRGILHQSHSETLEQSRTISVGAGREISNVEIAPTAGQTTPDLAPVRSVARSTSSSMTTISQPSGPPSINLNVDTIPPFDLIDVGDEAEPGQQGQTDRADGKVDAVFRLHSSRRMKPTSSGRGVSIPSQRRWCRYIHLLFEHLAPPVYLNPGQTRVLLKSVKMILNPPSGWTKPLTSLVVGGEGIGKAWASVARYDDEYLSELRQRGETAEIAWGGVGGDGGFDSKKMFRSCGKMVEIETIRESDEFHVHHLEAKVPDGSSSLVLDADREFRLKLHLGRLPLGWLWIIPAFHISLAHTGIQRIHRLTFSRSQIDFPLGPGQMIHQVVIELETLAEHDQRSPTRLLSPDEEVAKGFNDDSGERVKEEGE